MTKPPPIIIALALAVFACAGQAVKDESVLFFGLRPPGSEPEIFAPGVVSSIDQREMGCAAYPGGKEFYFCRAAPTGSNQAIWVVREEDGKMTDPEVVSFSGVFNDVNPFVTPDGKHMIFYRMSFEEAKTRRGSWIVEREGDSWAEPRYLVDEYCVTTHDLRTFHFNFVPGVKDISKVPSEARELGMRTLDDGEFSEPECLKGYINSPVWDAHGRISPDGSYLVYDSSRPGGFDEFDIYVSFRNPDGTWSTGHNLGEKINRGRRSQPSISRDGRYLFFCAEGDIWWVNANIINQLKARMSVR